MIFELDNFVILPNTKNKIELFNYVNSILTLYLTGEYIVKENFIFGTTYLRFGNIIIAGELLYGPEECLILDNDENIVDGFICAKRSIFLFKGKPIWDCLIALGYKTKDYNNSDDESND